VRGDDHDAAGYGGERMMKCIFSNAEKKTSSGKWESKCDLCGKWHSSDYGFEMTCFLPGAGFGIRRKLCRDCAKKYADRLMQVHNTLDLPYDTEKMEQNRDRLERMMAAGLVKVVVDDQE
jgi:hypothetical protein